MDRRSAKLVTYGASTMIGVMQMRPRILMNMPNGPRLNRSRGRTEPRNLCQMVQEIVMMQENVHDTETRDMMALNSTDDPKLMQVMTNVAATVVHNAV
jgi:hypothetical protein